MLVMIQPASVFHCSFPFQHSVSSISIIPTKLATLFEESKFNGNIRQFNHNKIFAHDNNDSKLIENHKSANTRHPESNIPLSWLQNLQTKPELHLHYHETTYNHYGRVAMPYLIKIPYLHTFRSCCWQNHR